MTGLRRRGVTFIELLVILAILGFLLAFLVPVISQLQGECLPPTIGEQPSANRPGGAQRPRCQWQTSTHRWQTQ